MSESQPAFLSTSGDPLDALLCPQSIALVGASDSRDSWAVRLYENLKLMNFPVRFYPICAPQLRCRPVAPTFVVGKRSGETVMLSRRALMMAGGGFAFAAGQARAAAVMTDDGYYREDWFLDSFLELADDLQSAVAAGKQLAVMWEQRGCPYCRETHLEIGRAHV
jgi:hypothetical protein